MPRGVKSETITQKAERLERDFGLLQLALRCMTNGTFKWGNWTNADIIVNYETDEKIRKDVRFGVGRAAKYRYPIILRESRNGDGESNDVRPLTVDQLIRQPALQIFDSGLDELKVIARDAEKVDADPNNEDSGRYQYEWPKEQTA
jgi:hypothetical protein